MLASYVEQNFKGNRIVFAGSGMEHQELVSLVEPLVGSMKASDQAEQPASTYIGGDFRYVDDLFQQLNLYSCILLIQVKIVIMTLRRSQWMQSCKVFC